MSGEKLLITVDSMGETKVEAVGFKDAGCLKATKSVEEALGVVEEQTKKPEAYIPETSVGMTNKIGS